MNSVIPFIMFKIQPTQNIFYKIWMVIFLHHKLAAIFYEMPHSCLSSMLFGVNKEWNTILYEFWPHYDSVVSYDSDIYSWAAKCPHLTGNPRHITLGRLLATPPRYCQLFLLVWYKTREDSRAQCWSLWVCNPFFHSFIVCLNCLFHSVPKRLGWQKVT